MQGHLAPTLHALCGSGEWGLDVLTLGDFRWKKRGPPPPKARENANILLPSHPGGWREEGWGENLGAGCVALLRPLEERGHSAHGVLAGCLIVIVPWTQHGRARMKDLLGQIEPLGTPALWHAG
jgi:hypothetical protein